MLKRIGSLAAIIIAIFYLLALYLFVTIKPIKNLLLVFTVKPCTNLQANTFCYSLGSTLLFIESTTIDLLYLWVIRGQHQQPSGGVLPSLPYVSAAGRGRVKLAPPTVEAGLSRARDPTVRAIGQGRRRWSRAAAVV